MIRYLLAFLLVIGQALLPGKASAVDPVAWDTTFGTPGVIYATDGSIANRSIQGSGFRVMYAVDWSAKTIAEFVPYVGVWRGASGSESGTLASVTMYSFSSLGSATLYPYIRFTSTGGTDKLHTGSTIQNLIPSGYTTLDSACGTTVTFDPSKIASGMSLSDGNTVATYSGSGGLGGAATCGLAAGSSNKTVFEVEYPSSGGVWPAYTEVGLINSSFTIGNQSVASTNSIGRCTGGCGEQWYFNSTPGGAVYTTTSSNTAAQNFNRGARATVSKSSGKWYWEVTISQTTGGYVTGVVDGGFAATDSTKADRAYPGNPTTGGFGFNGSGCAGSTCGAASGSFVSPADGDVIGWAMDCTGSPCLVWFKAKNNGGTYVWYGKGTCSVSGPGDSCGISNATGWTAPLYPAASLQSSSSNSGGTLVINGGATAFTHAVPSGYSPLDPQTTVPRSRARIFGAIDSILKVVHEFR